MLSEKLRQNFRDRVKGEREVLDLINSSGKFQHELPGLDEKVLVLWISDAGVDAVVGELLKKISIGLRLDHCVSNELFPGESYDSVGNVKDLVRELKKSC